MHKIIIENDKIIDSDIKYLYKEKKDIFGISEINFDINTNEIFININSYE